MNERLKNIIFSKLYEDLSHLELIPYEDSIWFVDREDKTWFLEYEKSGLLWWRYSFFIEFFKVFSTERNEFEPIISEWVEEILNCKVITPNRGYASFDYQMEEVLNCKVETSNVSFYANNVEMEEVLNCKVTKTKRTYNSRQYVIKEVLKHKVTKIEGITLNQFVAVDDMLRVITPHQDGNSHEDIMERIL